MPEVILNILPNSGGYNPQNNEGWKWSVNIYQESISEEYILGDNRIYASSPDAQNAHTGEKIKITLPADGYIWFYIQDPTPANNTGTITLNAQGVPF